MPRRSQKPKPRRLASDRSPEVVITRITPMPLGDDAMKWSFVASLDPWAVTCEARMVGGRLDMTKLGIELDPFAPSVTGSSSEPNESKQPLTFDDVRLTSAVLRKIPVTGILEAFRAHLLLTEPIYQDVRRHLGRPVSKARRQAVASESKTLRGNVLKRGARRQLGDSHFRRVAERRLALESERVGRGVNSKLAAEFGVNVETIRDWLAACREREYLAPARQGQRAAFPGTRLLEEWEHDRTEEP